MQLGGQPHGEHPRPASSLVVMSLFVVRLPTAPSGALLATGTSTARGSVLPQGPHDAIAHLALRTGSRPVREIRVRARPGPHVCCLRNADHELGPPAVMWRWECLPIGLGVADTLWHIRSGP